MKTKLVGIISGGVLTDVFSADPNIEFELIDWDNIEEGDYENETARNKAYKYADELEEKARNEMHCIY